MLKSAHHSRGESVAVTLPAEIDVVNAGQVQAELNAALDGGVMTVIADMSRTTFCDSAGARVLLCAHRRAGGMGADLRLVVTQRAVRRLFEINGLDQIMHVYASLDTAQGSIADASREDGSAAEADGLVPGALRAARWQYGGAQSACVSGQPGRKRISEQAGRA